MAAGSRPGAGEALTRQVGQQALGQYLSTRPSIPGPTLPCRCGGELRYQRQREAHLISAFGPVAYRRGYYAGCACGWGQAPLDEHLNLTPGGVTSGLDELMALAGIEQDFDATRQWLEIYLLFSVSENTIHAQGWRVLADFAPELVFVGDGAVWIWNLVSRYYPQAVQIVDWYHAVEHLETVASLAFAAGEERQSWLATVSDQLWQGQVPDVIAACRGLAQRCRQIETEAQYFYQHAARMDYARFRAAGYAIGSEMVESACKQIVTQRLKISGAQWTVDGAVQTAKARAAWLRGECDLLDRPRSLLPLAA